MRLVLDTNVLVAGWRSPLGGSAKVLTAILRRQALLVATPALFLEYEAVMKRPEHAQASQLTLDEIDVALDALARSAIAVHPHYRYRPLLSDSDDEMVMEAAINGGC